MGKARKARRLYADNGREKYFCEVHRIPFNCFCVECKREEKPMTTKEPMPDDETLERISDGYDDLKDDIYDAIASDATKRDPLVSTIAKAHIMATVNYLLVQGFDLSRPAPDKIVIDRAQLEGMMMNENDYGYGEGENYAEGFNDCIRALIAAQMNKLTES